MSRRILIGLLLMGVFSACGSTELTETTPPTRDECYKAVETIHEVLLEQHLKRTGDSEDPVWQEDWMTINRLYRACEARYG